MFDYVLGNAPKKQQYNFNFKVVVDSLFFKIITKCREEGRITGKEYTKMVGVISKGKVKMENGKCTRSKLHA